MKASINAKVLARDNGSEKISRTPSKTAMIPEVRLQPFLISLLAKTMM
jgi:hypothetical protein